MTTWITYTEGQVVKCPAAADRRSASERIKGLPPSDRRSAGRPCGARLCRVGAESVVMVRVVAQGNPGCAGISVIQDCPSNHCAAVLELRYLAAANEAA